MDDDGCRKQRRRPPSRQTPPAAKQREAAQTGAESKWYISIIWVHNTTIGIDMMSHFREVKSYIYVLYKPVYCKIFSLTINS